jgi:Mn-dependent DtxR family transcriptional regulator
VSKAIRRLQDGGYLVMNKDKTLVLTDAGHEVASRVYERHCVLKNGLVSLGVDPEVAERDACGIEHLISDETFEIIKRLWMERRAQ